MEKILYTSPEDGGVCIVIPASKAELERVLGPLTEEQYEIFVWERSIAQSAITPVSIPDSAIPPSREFRDEWRQEGDEIVVEVGLARLKQMDRIREMRQKKFEEMGFPQRLNAQIENAILDEATKIELQRLRDITQTFDLSIATNADELEALWPEGIDKHPIYL
jgi:hypothetical protein